MEYETLWNKRCSLYYQKMMRYFSLIASSVFYSLLLVGSIFAYYYIQFLKWVPSSFPTEIVVAFLVSIFFLQTKIRTFIVKADRIFLLPLEKKLSSYFRKSFYYTAVIDGFKTIILLGIITPLIHYGWIQIDSIIVTIATIAVNLYFAWSMQWMTSRIQITLHTLIRLLTLTFILYFVFIDYWYISIIILLCTVGFMYFLFGTQSKRINWDYLITQEERTVLQIYNFINIYVDVPHLKYAYKRRMWLSWLVKKTIRYHHSSFFRYLFTLLFVRYNSFYYLYIRLTFIGFILIYCLPSYQWIAMLIILFMTGYQLLPLQAAINDLIRTYPVSFLEFKTSFLKLLTSLLSIQLLILTMAHLSHPTIQDILLSLLAGCLFIYFFVYIFAPKRIRSFRYLD
ncbi:ABC transporter permease [Bacillus massiliigorillae]|uniref:ABC transporter permease n=1 Tax=Bacillus massiliigorillae TaxID=1243664 RepID=UPI0003A95967|nr:ABC transporter permease [Bacillus massiliigorillae]